MVTDDAYPVARGDVEVEFGLELETTTQSYSLTAPFAFGFGLTDWLEVALKPSALYVDDQDASPRQVGGVGDLVLEAKAKLPFRPWDLDLALVPSLKLPTADEDRGLGTGEVDGGAVFVVSKAFTETHKLHFNVGYTVTGKAPEAQLQDVLFIGLAGEATIPGVAEDRLQFVAEVFGTGFHFSPVTQEMLAATVLRVTRLWRNQGIWRRLQANALRTDVSWARSAERYAALYREMVADAG